MSFFLLVLSVSQADEATEANRRGMAAGEKRNYDLAIAGFTEAIRLNPDYAEAYYNRGIVFALQGDSSKAIADYSEAIRLNPNSFEAYYNRGKIFANNGQLDRAIADYSEAIRLNPEMAAAHDNRGNTYSRKGDRDKAITDYNEAIRLNTNNAIAYSNRGLAYQKKGEYDKALADCHEAIRLNPKLASAYNNLAWLLAVCPNASFRNGEKAVACAREACELTEWKHAAYLDTLAAAYAEVGSFDEAIKCERRYLETKPSRDALNEGRQRLNLYEQKKPYREEIQK